MSEKQELTDHQHIKFNVLVPFVTKLGTKRRKDRWGDESDLYNEYTQKILDYFNEWEARNVPEKPATLPVKPLFEKLCEVLGQQRLKYTPARAAKLRRRLKTFSEQEIIQAAKAIADNEYLMGDNPSGKKYGTVDYLIRNDEKLDEWLESARGSGNNVDLRSIEI